MVILIWWREIIISLLVVLCLWLINSNQKLDFKVKETQLIHASLVNEAEAKNAKLVADVQSERKMDAENYAKEISSINDKYNAAMLNNGRMQSEIKTYSDRLHTVNRETVENYARTCGILYGQIRTEVVGLGQYASELNAELNKVTKSPD